MTAVYVKITPGKKANSKKQSKKQSKRKAKKAKQ